VAKREVFLTPAETSPRQIELAVRSGLAVDNARRYRETQVQAHVALNATLRDAVQERSAAADQLQQALQTRDEFLAAAALDLKNPLTGIKSTIQLLPRRVRSGKLDPDAVSDSLERGVARLPTRVVLDVNLPGIDG
jgi:signal transduction histidine kinase